MPSLLPRTLEFIHTAEMATNGHAAPSRRNPALSLHLEASKELRLGEFADDLTLNLSEARIILDKSIEARRKRLLEQNPNAQLPRDTETLAKTREYLEYFAVFKDVSDAELAERTINSYSSGGMVLERFEKSQLGSLVPTCADEAKALIPSLEKKVEEGVIQEEDLEALCRELTRIKKQTQL